MPISAQLTDFVVNTTTNNDQTGPSITTLADGRIFVAYRSFDDAGGDGAANTLRGRLFNADGTASGNDFIINSTGAGSQLEPSVSAMPDGRIFVAWESSDATGTDASGKSIRATILDPSDLSSPPPDFLVNNVTITGDQLDVSVATGADGITVVTWVNGSTGDGDSGSIGARAFAADGTPLGDDFIVNTTSLGNQFAPSVTAINGGFVVAFTSDLDVRARLLDASGQPLGMGDAIITTVTAGQQHQPALAALANGGFVAVWRSDEIKLRLFDAAGNPTSTEIDVNTTTVGTQARPAVAELADGRFVVVYQSGGNDDGDGDGIRAQLLDSDGVRIGSDVLVNTSVAGDQQNPVVTALADGRFVVSFNSHSASGDDSSGASTRARIFDPTIFNGTSGVDTWTGGSLTDHINGAGGNDTLRGEGGDDFISGDGGADDLYGGAGDDRMFGGLGTDYFEGGAGRDEIHGGADVDVIKVIDGDDAAGEIYDGGAGTNDYLVTEGYDGAYDIDLRNDTIDGIEGLQLNSAANMGTRIGIVRINASQLDGIVNLVGDPDAASTVRLEITMGSRNTFDLSSKGIFNFDSLDRFVVTGDGDNETITGGSAIDSISGGGGNDQLHTLAGNIAANEVYDGGAGTGDKLFIDSPLVPDNYTADLRNVTLRNLEGLTIGDPGSNSLTATIQLRASQVGTGLFSASSAIVGNAFGDTSEVLEFTMGTATSLNLSGMTFANWGADAFQNDHVVIAGGTVAAMIIGSRVNDSITGSAANDTIRGGAGKDTLNGGAGTSDVLDYSERTQAIVYTIGTSSVVFNAAVEDTVSNFEGIIGGSKADTFFGNAVANLLSGGAGNDTLRGGLGNDTLNGGANIDTADFADKSTKVTATLVNGGATVTVSATDKDTLIGIENLTGGSAGDALSGDKAANVLVGNGGKDTLKGGLGADTLTGSAGNDKFVFNSKLGAGNIDTITDFKHNGDLLQLDDAIFRKIGSSLSSGEFYARNGATQAHDKDDRIVYDKKSGKLYYDDDGKGGHAAIHFATLTNKPTLDHGDFDIV